MKVSLHQARRVPTSTKWLCGIAFICMLISAISALVEKHPNSAVVVPIFIALACVFFIPCNAEDRRIERVLLTKKHTQAYQEQILSWKAKR